MLAAHCSQAARLGAAQIVQTQVGCKEGQTEERRGDKKRVKVQKAVGWLGRRRGTRSPDW